MTEVIKYLRRASRTPMRAYEGELKDQRLTGTWSQTAGSLPLVLTRAK